MLQLSQKEMSGMTIKELKALLKTEPYDFLRKNENLGDRICLLAMGGSLAYGTETEKSDVDIRGFALRGKTEILTGSDFEQVFDEKTDTVIYSFDKLARLLCDVNPNTIELLGCRPEHYLYLNRAGRLLLDNAKLFLSKKAAFSFGGYAGAQLRRLENKTARSMDKAQIERYILRTIDHAMCVLKERYDRFPDEALRVYTADVGSGEEIVMDVRLDKYPIRDYVGMWSDMKSIVRSYNTLGKRNGNAVTHCKLGKHMMHLVRLYYMCFDILEQEKIITYRENEHELLISIRNGAFLDENDTPTPEFYEMVNALDKRIEYAEKNTALPEYPDMKRIKELWAAINEFAFTGQ